MLVRDCRIPHSSDLCDYVQTNGTKGFSSLEAGPGVWRAFWQLILALLVKLGLMIVTVGMKVPAGLYIPSLAIGAIMGRLIGILTEQLIYAYPFLTLYEQSCGVNCITPGLYAMVGAAAFLGGVTRMTVGLVVIMFEVTGGVRYILPVMLAVMTSKWVGDGLCKKGIFEALIELNDYPFLDSKEEFHHATLASDVMKPRNGEPGEPFIVLIQDGMTVGKIEEILIEYSYNGFPVIVSIESQYLVGFVLRRDLVMALQHYKNTRSDVTSRTEVLFVETPHGNANALQLRKIVDTATITITDATPMETAIDMFKKLGLRHLLVTLKGRLLGIITKKDALRHVKKHDF